MHKFTSGTIFRMLCLIVMACSDPDDIEPVDCSLSDLSVIISGTENVSACNTTDGTVSVSATGGKAPYQFSINDGSLIDGDADGQHRFTQLSPGTYTVHVIDANGCETNSEATVGAEGSTLAVSVIPEEDTECITGNGKITVEVTGGVPPYRYSIDSETFSDSPVFSALRHGSYTVLVKDEEDCIMSNNTEVSRGDMGISFSSTISSIIQSRCAIPACHDGSTAQPNWNTFENVQSSAQAIRTRTSAKTMPPAGQTPLTDEEIALIACWVEDGAKNN